MIAANTTEIADAYPKRKYFQAVSYRYMTAVRDALPGPPAVMI